MKPLATILLASLLLIGTSIALGLLDVGAGPASANSPPVLAVDECEGDCYFEFLPNSCPDNCVVTFGTCSHTSIEDCGGCAGQLPYTLACDTGFFAGSLNHLGACPSATNRVHITCPSNPSINLAVMEVVCLQCL